MEFINKLLLIFLFIISGCTFPKCMEDITQELNSPSNEYVAKLCKQDCGATVDFSTIVYIDSTQSNNKKCDNKNTVFKTMGINETTLEWKNLSSLNVYYKGNKDNIFLQKENLKNIDINYIFEEEDKNQYNKKGVVEQFIDFIESEDRTNEDIDNFIKDHNLKEDDSITKAIKSLWNDVQNK